MSALRVAVLVLSHMATLVGGIAGASWLLQGADVQTAEHSPNGAYLLVTRSPTRLQRLLAPEMEMPAVVELYRVYDEALLCRSALVDRFLGGQRIWEADEVSLGMQVRLRPFGSGRSEDCGPAAHAQQLYGPTASPPSFTRAVGKTPSP